MYLPSYILVYCTYEYSLNLYLQLKETTTHLEIIIQVKVVKEEMKGAPIALKKKPKLQITTL
jgi:hypothetical protein